MSVKVDQEQLEWVRRKEENAPPPLPHAAVTHWPAVQIRTGRQGTGSRRGTTRRGCQRALQEEEEEGDEVGTVTG